MRSILIIFFSLLTAKVAAPDLKLLVIIKSEPIEIYNRLISAIVKVESAGDTMAFNPEEDAYGAFQIRLIRLLDYNNRTGKNCLLVDCYNIKISKEIFLYYANRTKYQDFEAIARNWNGSGGMTLVYWVKVKAFL